MNYIIYLRWVFTYVSFIKVTVCLSLRFIVMGRDAGHKPKA